MSTPTAAAASPVATASAVPSAPPVDATLGARLAAASRQAQGFALAVDDPAVLAELRELCGAPRPTRQAAAAVREGPAPGTV